MKVFSPKDPDEIPTLGIDFGNLLVAGETISAGAFSIAVDRGTDAEVASMLVGTAAISGSLLSQQVQSGVSGNKYKLIGEILTSRGNVYQESGYLSVRSL